MLNIKKTLHSKDFPILFTLLVSIISILSAKYMQFILNKLPCSMCLIQRKIWYTTGIITIVLYIITRYIKKDYIYKLSLIIISAMLILTITASIYHFGIQQEWWEHACEIPKYISKKIDEIDFNSLEKAQDLSLKLPICSIADKFLKIPLPVWNFIIGFKTLIIVIYSNKIKNK